MDIYEIESIIREGGASLAQSLYEYWPALPKEDEKETSGDMAERNITLHFGRTLLDAGFWVYAEHPLEDKSKVDLLGLNYREKLQLIIEEKKGQGKM